MASLISVGQVIDLSLDHYRKHFKELFAISLWVVVASLPSVVGKILAPIGNGTAPTAGDWVTFTLSAVGGFAVLVVSIWMYAALILAVRDQAAGKHTDLKKINAEGWKSFLPYLLLSLLLGVIFLAIASITLPGFIMLFVGGVQNSTEGGMLAALGAPVFLIGIVLSIGLLAKYSLELAFAPYVLLLEKQDIVQSIRSSLALVRGRWWATLLRFAVPKLIYFLLIFISTYVIAKALEILIAVVSTSSPVATLLIYTVSLLFASLIPALTTPLIIATDYYLYDSLRKTR